MDELGGMVAAVERGVPQREIAASAYRAQRDLEAGARVQVGVNAYAREAEGAPIPTLRVDESVERQQVASLAEVKRTRDPDEVHAALAAVREACRGDDNVMPPMIRAAKAYCTEQEICDVMRDVFGRHRDRAEF